LKDDEKIPNLRMIAIQYLELPTHRRVEIAKHLGAFVPMDMLLKSFEQAKQGFIRVRERGLLENLEAQLNQ
jgi:hypothetical protein